MIKLDKVIRCQFVVNNEPVYSHDPKEILKQVFSSVPDICYWSPDSLREFVVETFHMICEFGEHVKKELKESGSVVVGEVSQRFSRFSTWSSKALKFLPKDHEKLVHFVYNSIMVFEGNGLLAGFGMSNKHKDKISGNPERVTICPLPADIPARRKENDY